MTNRTTPPTTDDTLRAALGEGLDHGELLAILRRHHPGAEPDTNQWQYPECGHLSIVQCYQAQVREVASALAAEPRGSGEAVRVMTCAEHERLHRPNSAIDFYCVAHGANRELPDGSYCHDTDGDGWCHPDCPACPLDCPHSPCPVPYDDAPTPPPADESADVEDAANTTALFIAALDALDKPLNALADIARRAVDAVRPAITCMRCYAGFTTIDGFAVHRRDTSCGDPERSAALKEGPR